MLSQPPASKRLPQWTEEDILEHHRHNTKNNNNNSNKNNDQEHRLKDDDDPTAKDVCEDFESVENESVLMKLEREAKVYTKLHQN